MRKLILPAILIAIASAVFSCKDQESDMTHMSALRDTIFKAYPTLVASITIKPEDRENLIVVLGGNQLYASSPEKKQQMSTDIGVMALGIFGKDNYLKTGKLIFTKNERNESLTPSDGIGVNINIDSLKKVGMK